MKIRQIDVYQVSYRLLDQKYAWSMGHSVESFISTVIKVSTDEGIDGFGEVCPVGSAYMDAFARGVPKGIGEIGPLLVGQDPRQLNIVNQIMDTALQDTTTSNPLWTSRAGTYSARRQGYPCVPY